MSKAGQRNGLEPSVANLEAFEGAIITAAEQLANRMGELASEGVSIQDLEWMARVSDVAERIMGPLERLFNEINAVPTEANIIEEEQEGGDDSGREQIQADTADIATNERPLKVVRSKTIPGTLSEREQKIWQRIMSGGSTTEWFGQKDLDIESIGFSSPSAKNKAFSQFCKRAIAAGLLIDNGKERGGRKYMISPSAPVSLVAWELKEAVDAKDDTPGAQETKAIDPGYTTAPPNPIGEPNEKQDIYDPRFEITIRGETHSFTPLEYKIIQALLDGRAGTREIIAYINGHDGLEDADPEFYNNEFQPALNNLKGLSVGDTQLVKAHFIDGPNGKFMRLKLPDGARIESKKGIETLRFTDSSTFIGAPGSRNRKRRGEDGDGDKDGIAVTTRPTPQTSIDTPPLVLKVTKPISAAIISETGLVDSEGKNITLEPQRKAVLDTLRSGVRLTVADIAKQINPEGGDDATFKSIVADELAGLQKIIGTTKLRRKKKPGTQAKWWLEVT